MQSLFSNEGRTRLDELVGPYMLCAFDFDGTLAPIVPHPEQVRLPDSILQRLTALADYAPIAVITGRSIADISARLGFVPDFTVGNHGMEGVPGWEESTAEHAQVSAGWRMQLEQMLREPASDPAILLEDKRYSLSLHYRQARDPARTAAWLEQVFCRLSPVPRVVAGKYVFNLLPEDGCHKGNALERLMQICDARSALYAGDDVTDEDVFRLHRRDVLSVRIEPSPNSDAEFFLPQPDDMVWLLDELAGRLRAFGARRRQRGAVAGNRVA
jgi:trehalose 6-phosphate phosphatase